MSATTSLQFRVYALFVSLIVGRSALAVEPEAPSKPSYGRGPHVVEAKLLDWRDAKRGREVPVKIYLPRDLKEPAPVIIFSHGLGGSRNGYTYLGEHWASRGYASVHVQHLGSDQSVFTGGPALGARQRLEAASRDPSAIINRPKDISFTVDELERLNAPGQTFAGRFDLKKLGIAGHSFGAWTTLAVVGQQADTPGGRSLGLADPRFKAAISMSAPGPRKGADARKTYENITVPVLHLTGTLDESPIGQSSASDRRIPFDHIAAKDQFLITFAGGDHMIFSGRMRPIAGARRTDDGTHGDPQLDAGFQELIRLSTSAFWEGWLNDDASAKDWLKSGAFKQRLGESGTFEQK